MTDADTSGASAASPQPRRPGSLAELLAFGQQVLASQPFSRLIGAELLALTPQTAELAVPITADVLQQHGFVHGGVVSYAADNVLTYAGGVALGTAVVTSEFKINYLRPAVSQGPGARLLARGRAVHAGRNQAVCQAEVFVQHADGSETLCAVAQGTIARIGEASAPAQASTSKTSHATSSASR